MKFTTPLFAILFIATLFMSCSKNDGEDGAIGPQGAQGPAGAMGADGPAGAMGADGQEGAQGETGEQGATGTANVIYSDWIASELGSMPAAEESEQLLVSLGLVDFNTDQDLIIVYGRRPTNAINNDVRKLPFELFSQNEVYRFRLSEGFTFAALYVEAVTSDGGTNLFTYFDDYRYVIIPGGVSASGKSSIDYGKMTYEEIIEHFNIPE